MVQNKQLIFAQVPSGYPVPGKDLVVKAVELDITKAPAGGVVTKNLFISFDPYQRGRMREAGTKSYTPPFEIGAPIDNGGVARIVASDHKDFKVGDLVTGNIPCENFSALNPERVGGLKKLENPHNLPLSHFTGALGMPGLTAYSSFYEIGKPKKGETIFISAASGAVGQLVGQLAKREGLTVIGSAGSDEKVEFVQKELKFDAAFNYKTTTSREALAKYAPQGIDIYFDNVGGEALEAALDAANQFARFIECGMISYYNVSNPAEAHWPKNLMHIVAKRLTIQGFIVFDANMGPLHAADHQKNVQKWLAEKQMVAKETITEGIDNAAEGFVGMLQGKNFGKAVLKLDHDDE